MRTLKALLCLSALAGGIAVTQAQNVYSLNIVGYANVPNPAQYSFMTTPFKVTTAVSNGANEIIINSGDKEGDQILIWNGASWNTFVMNSAQPTGFEDANGNGVPAPILDSGLGFLYNNQQGVSNNITFVGDVRTGTNNITLRASPIQAVGSPIPFAGGVSSALQMNNATGVFDASEIQTLVRNEPAGTVSGFFVSVFNSGQASGTGFENRNGVSLDQPQIKVGQGFFFNNQSGAPITWTQVLNTNP
jgi:hypothetical protein